MEVVKLRGQDHCLGRYLYNISGDGVTVLAPGTGGPPEGDTAKTGISDLDDIISGMQYGSSWHFAVREEALFRPLMDAMIRETLASGDCLVYAASASDDFSLDSFRKRFGPEAELKGRVAIMDPFGMPVPEKLKDFFVTGDMGPGHVSSRQRLMKGKRCRIIADAGSMEKAFGAQGALKTYDYALGHARGEGGVLAIFSGPSCTLSADVSASADGVVDVWGYGGYALLRVRKAPYAKSFEPYVARLENGQLRLKRH